MDTLNHMADSLQKQDLAYQCNFRFQNIYQSIPMVDAISPVIQKTNLTSVDGVGGFWMAVYRCTSGPTTVHTGGI